MTNTAVSLYRALAGFAIGAVMGIGLAWPFAATLARWFFDPIISVGFHAQDRLSSRGHALLGVYDVSKITMVALEAIFRCHRHHQHPRWSASFCGRRAIWGQASASSSGRSRFPHRCRRSSPGCRLRFPLRSLSRSSRKCSWAATVSAAQNTAARFADSRGVFAGIVEIAVLGYALVKIMSLIRRRLLLWHQEALSPSTV
jgi:hypothetical protein